MIRATDRGLPGEKERERVCAVWNKKKEGGGDVGWGPNEHNRRRVEEENGMLRDVCSVQNEAIAKAARKSRRRSSAPHHVPGEYSSDGWSRLHSVGASLSGRSVPSLALRWSTDTVRDRRYLSRPKKNAPSPPQ